jgi:HTH-type transcriptional regulator / antitoxin HigA
MMSKKIIATPPGATIKEQLEDREMTQKEFARRMDMSEKHISRLINGEVQLTPDVALRLEHVLGIPAEFWNNLEAIYREKCARVQEENEMEADIELAKAFPYSEMAKLGWVAATRNAAEKVINLRNYFQVAKLGALNNLVMPGIAYRRLGGNEQTDYALAAWAQQARIRARELDVRDVNIAKLQESIPAIREMTMESPEAFCAKLVDMMAQCGIALVFLPHMSGSFLHGATFFDGKKIVMGLTVRGRDADRFWFSLLHEVGHVINGHLRQVEETSEENEHEADAFAAEALIPGSKFKDYIAEGVFTEATVRNFASQIGIAPGIVVGRLQKDNIIRFNQMNGLKIQYSIN